MLAHAGPATLRLGFSRARSNLACRVVNFLPSRLFPSSLAGGVPGTASCVHQYATSTGVTHSPAPRLSRPLRPGRMRVIDVGAAATGKSSGVAGPMKAPVEPAPPPTFNELGLSSELLAALEALNIKEPTEIQVHAGCV